ncbi:MAG: hypothetical protein R6U32_00520 [Candidatus Woesearchaeota archaeon]
MQKEETLTPNVLTQDTKISILSPENNRQYTSQTVLLMYSTQPEGVQCSYSLNDDSSFTTLQTQQTELKAKEGNNNIKVKCNENIASTQFTVNTTKEPATIFDEMKGEVLNLEGFYFLL